MEEPVTVCNRCGSTACVGKKLCLYDHLPHETADVPAFKLERQAEVNRSTRVKPRKAKE